MALDGALGAGKTLRHKDIRSGWCWIVMAGFRCSADFPRTRRGSKCRLRAEGRSLPVRGSSVAGERGGQESFRSFCSVRDDRILVSGAAGIRTRMAFPPAESKSAASDRFATAPLGREPRCTGPLPVGLASGPLDARISWPRGSSSSHDHLLSCLRCLRISADTISSHPPWGKRMTTRVDLAPRQAYHSDTR